MKEFDKDGDGTVNCAEFLLTFFRIGFESRNRALQRYTHTYTWMEAFWRVCVCVLLLYLCIYRKRNNAIRRFRFPLSNVIFRAG